MPSSVSTTPDAQPRGRPFNEQAALQELERLQRAIEETRRRRKETGDAFDAWVRSFQKERHKSALAEATPVIEPVVPVVSPPGPAVISDVEPPASIESPSVPAPVTASPVARRRKPFPMVPAVAGAAIAIVAAIVLIGRPWETSTPGSGARDPGSVGSVAAPTAQTANAESRSSNPQPRTQNPENPAPNSEPRTPNPAPSVSAAAPLSGELTAVRRVWVRIITDGNRIERELPAGTVVPLRAQRTLTLRIGDAGAVKVTIGHRDQGALGRDGEVVMRTFTAQTPAH